MDDSTSKPDFLSADAGMDSVKTAKQYVGECMIWDKISIWCLYALTFLAPLFFLPYTISPVNLNKQVLIIIITLLALISWVAKAFTAGEITYHKNKINLAVLFVVVATGISAIFSNARYNSVGNLYALQDSFLNIMLYGLNFLLYSNMLSKSEEMFKMLLVFIQSLGFLSILTLLQINRIFLLPWEFASDQRVATTFHTLGTQDFSTHTPVAIMMAVGIIILVSVCVTTKLKPLMKAWSATFGITMLANLFIINSQVVWVGLVLAMIVIVSYKLFVGRVSKIKDIACPIFILAVSVIFLVIGPSGLIKNKAQSELVLGSAHTTWNITKQTMGDYKNLLLGSGPATFRYDHAQYRDITVNNGDRWHIRFNNGYSSFLTYLTTVGSLGILAWLFLIGSFLVVFVKTLSVTAQRVQGSESHPHPDCIILSASASVIFLFFIWFYYPLNLTVTLFLFILLGLVVAASSTIHSLHNSSSKHSGILHIFLSSDTNKKTTVSFVAVIILVLTISLSVGGVYITGKKYMGALYASKGINIYNASRNADEAIKNLATAISLDEREDTYYNTAAQIQFAKAKETLEKLTELNADVSSDAKAREDLKQKFDSYFKIAIADAQTAVQINPSDPTHWLTLGAILENRVSLFDDADVLARQAYEEYMKLEPKNPNGPLGLGRINIAISDRYNTLINNPETKKQKDGDKIIVVLEKLKTENLEKALQNMSAALKLKGNYAMANYLMAQIYGRQNKLPEVIEQLVISSVIYPQDIGVSFQLGMAYYQNKEYDNAKTELSRTLSLDEKHIRARFYLGIIYDNLGNKDAAKKELEKALKLSKDDAGASAKIKQILDNINAGKPGLGE